MLKVERKSPPIFQDPIIQNFKFKIQNFNAPFLKMAQASACAPFPGLKPGANPSRIRKKALL